MGIFMIGTTNKTIVQALFIIGYERDFKIRTKQFEIEKVLEPLFKNSSVNTNLPDDFNPHAPRVTLTQGNVSVYFSQLTAQLTIDIDNSKGQPIDVIRDSIAKKINLFQSCMDKIIVHEQQRERGLVLTVHYSVDSSKFADEAIFEHLQSKFMKITPLGLPASAGFNVGYKTDDNFFITLSVGDYKMVSGDDFPVSSTTQWLDVSAFPVRESGIELKIDVNSKPMTGLNQPDDVTGIILEKSFDFVLVKADEFMGILE